MTKEFLSHHKIEYTEYDISKDKAALAESMRVSNGARTTPVIVIGDEVIVGFNRNGLIEAFKKLGYKFD